MKAIDKKNYNDHNYIAFKYRDNLLKIWFIEDHTVDNIEEFALSIIERSIYKSNVLHDLRNQLWLVEKNKVSFLYRDIVLKDFRLSRLYDRLRFRFINSKALRSFNMAIKLKDIGIKTPDPLMAVELRGQFNKLIKSYFVTDYLEYDYNLLSIIREKRHPFRERVIEFIPEIAKDIRKMHDSGIIHNDMHAGNILIKNIDQSPEFYYIDLNRAREKNKLSPKLRMKDLARFDLSDEELEALIKNYDQRKYNIYMKEFYRQKERRESIRNAKRTFRDIIKNEQKA